MIDWELVGMMAVFVSAGLIIAAVSVLGLTRTEKILAVIFFASLGGFFTTIRLRFPEFPELQTVADFERWMASLDRALQIANFFWWLQIAAGAAFLLVAVRHIWGERATLGEKLGSETARPRG